MLYPTLKDTIHRLQRIALNTNTNPEEAKLSLQISFELAKYMEVKPTKQKLKKAK
jgi:hypothetical protein